MCVSHSYVCESNLFMMMFGSKSGTKESQNRFSCHDIDPRKNNSENVVDDGEAQLMSMNKIFYS